MTSRVPFVVFVAAVAAGCAYEGPKAFLLGRLPSLGELRALIASVGGFEWCLGYAILAVLAYVLLKFLLVPLEIRKTIHELGEEGVSCGYNSAEDGKPLFSRCPGNLPPPYPNSWFRVLTSQELPRGKVRYVQVLGQHLAVFRGEDGKARILDAYCPHLGANLAIGGKVNGNCLQCPFHGWEFNGAGKCTRIPYAEKVPDFAKTRSWQMWEGNGLICVWHNAEGATPTWEPILLPELTSGRFFCHGVSEHHVRAHIQEIPENGCDTAHLNFLHVPFVAKFIGNLFGLAHYWTATWTPGTGDKEHLAHISLTQAVTVCGRKVPGTSIAVNITQVGPGLVFLDFSTFLGRIVVLETVTPVQPMLQHAVHLVFADWKIPRFVAKLVLRALVVQFERDIPIWNNKTYLPKPLVVKQDGNIPQYRRWFAKFYTAKSGKNSTVTGLDW